MVGQLGLLAFVRILENVVGFVDAEQTLHRRNAVVARNEDHVHLFTDNLGDAQRLECAEHGVPLLDVLRQAGVDGSLELELQAGVRIGPERSASLAHQLRELIGLDLVDSSLQVGQSLLGDLDLAFQICPLIGQELDLRLELFGVRRDISIIEEVVVAELIVHGFLLENELPPPGVPAGGLRLITCERCRGRPCRSGRRSRRW